MVDEGIVTADQLTHALAEQDRTGQPLGEILVELGFASAGAVANSLAEQHGGLLKTEYGVSAGLRTMSDAGLANSPVRPVLPSPELRQTGEEAGTQDEPPALRVIPMYPPPADGPLLIPSPAVDMPDPPAQIPNAEEARIADLSARLDETAGKLRVSQLARDAFSTRVSELEALLASATPGDAAPQPDPAQASRIEQLEAHIQQLDDHIKAAAADRENIVQRYTELQTRFAAAQAATPEADPSQAARIQELEAQLQAAVQLAAPPAEHEPAAGDLRALAVNVAHEAMARLRDDLADRERQLAGRSAELARLRAEAEGVTSVEEEHLHVLFIRTESGFSLLQRSGPAPAVGETVEVDGDSEAAGHFVVRTHGRAVDGGPRCAYVERV